jgi:hypothetical protein
MSNPDFTNYKAKYTQLQTEHTQLQTEHTQLLEQMACLRILLGTLESPKHPKPTSPQAISISVSGSRDPEIESRDPESLSWSEEVVENPGLYLGQLI